MCKSIAGRTLCGDDGAIHIIMAKSISIKRWICCLGRSIPLHQEADHKGGYDGDSDECKQDLLQTYAALLPLTDLRDLLLLACHVTPLQA